MYDWKNLTAERAVYLGMGAEYGNVHRFRLEDGSKLEFLAFCWTWLDDCRGKPLIISHGDLTCDGGGEEGCGPYLPDTIQAF